MRVLFTVPAWLLILQMVLIELMLSVDNVAIIGAKVSHLPPDVPMRGRFLKRLGSERAAVYRIGFVGALVCRFAILGAIEFVADSPVVKGIGAAYLFIVFGMHLKDMLQNNEKIITHKRSAFWPTVISIIGFDIIFSIDNVVSAVSISSDLYIVYVGVGIGILTMWVATSVFQRLISWEPWLEHGAYFLLLAISIELGAKLLEGYETPTGVQFAISIGILVITVIIAKVPMLRKTVLLIRLLMQRNGNSDE